MKYKYIVYKQMNDVRLKGGSPISQSPKQESKWATLQMLSI